MRMGDLTGYGWLSHDPDLPDEIAGVHIEREATKTRVEEYTLVDRVVCGAECTTALDAATGYVADWHMLPYILAARGLTVEAIDADPRTMLMPAHPKVRRKIANIKNIPFPDNSFDIITCISTLEHCADHVCYKFSSEAARTINSNGLLIVTADNYPGVSPQALAGLFKVDFDIGIDHGDEDRSFPGSKRVAYLVARRHV